MALGTQCARNATSAENRRISKESVKQAFKMNVRYARRITITCLCSFVRHVSIQYLSSKKKINKTKKSRLQLEIIKNFSMFRRCKEKQLR